MRGLKSRQLELGGETNSLSYVLDVPSQRLVTTYEVNANPTCVGVQKRMLRSEMRICIEVSD